MKALLGRIAAEVLKDQRGSDELTRIVASGKEVDEVTLSNGKKYIISTRPMTDAELRTATQ
ncbi:hypothetical protein [Bowmanella dokdonensis]|uniref:Uncharacterized protein n=1 Tax=Bowmanella dokdonensis TaxID=751969 RepID=A0A939IS60_9ALTE|nr:hypothetical protein [Bowmanella dokdonensis]MBN7826096.1 hypothetical protein [Bowmanella dokdonensis]